MKFYPYENGGKASFSHIEAVVLTQEALAILEGGPIGFCPIKCVCVGGGGEKMICPLLMTSP